MNDAQPIAPTGEPEAGERFRAFMSYSHADAADARRLHRRLETYRLPRHLEPTAAKEGTPRRLGRIFRDREDLPAASDLSESVQQAMTVSEALIVLCSPEAKASPWVGKEIALFRRLHPGRPILAALIRGAPAQAFPVELTEGTEPLAADLRPEGDGRRLGFLKIVAGLAGVPLDALVQRDAQRRVRRITWVTLAALIAMVAMAAMTIVTLDAYRRAERARAAEAARFAEVRGLATFMLFELNSRMERVAGNAEARGRLAARAQHYLAALANSPDASPALKHEAARGFVALARIQGVPTEPNLGDNEAARRSLQTAIAIFASPDVARLGSAPDLVEAQALLAMIEAHVDTDTDAADTRLAEAARLLEAVPPTSRDARWRRARSQLRRSQLDMTTLGQRPDDILPLVERLEAEIGDWPEPQRRSRLAMFDRAVAQYHRGLHGYFTDDLAAAIDHLRRSEQILTTLDAARPNDPRVLYQLAWTRYVAFGAAMGREGGAGEAARLARGARDTVDRLLAIEPSDRSLRAFAGTIRGAEAQALAAEGHFDEALAIQREVVALYEQAAGPERPARALSRLATAGITLGNIASQSGDRPLACASYRAARDAMAEVERQGDVLGFLDAHRAGLDRNLRRCAGGARRAELEILE